MYLFIGVIVCWWTSTVWGPQLFGDLNCWGTLFFGWTAFVWGPFLFRGLIRLGTLHCLFGDFIYLGTSFVQHPWCFRVPISKDMCRLIRGPRSSRNLVCPKPVFAWGSDFSTPLVVLGPLCSFCYLFWWGTPLVWKPFLMGDTLGLETLFIGDLIII